MINLTSPERPRTLHDALLPWRDLVRSGGPKMGQKLQKIKKRQAPYDHSAPNMKQTRTRHPPALPKTYNERKIVRGRWRGYLGRGYLVATTKWVSAAYATAILYIFCIQIRNTNLHPNCGHFASQRPTPQIAENIADISHSVRAIGRAQQVRGPRGADKARDMTVFFIYICWFRRHLWIYASTLLNSKKMQRKG